MSNKKRVITLAELECAATKVMENNNSSKSSQSKRVVGQSNNRYEKTKQKASRLIGIFANRA